jgi:hypothetical protein
MLRVPLVAAPGRTGCRSCLLGAWPSLNRWCPRRRQGLCRLCDPGRGQAYFEANGGSPTNNVDNLDADHDGQACEDFDYGDGTGGGTGGGDNGGGDNGGGALPFTGPNDTLLPAGTALLLAGLALVGVTRYRARHARR